MRVNLLLSVGSQKHKAIGFREDVKVRDLIKAKASGVLLQLKASKEASGKIFQHHQMTSVSRKLVL